MEPFDLFVGIDFSGAKGPSVRGLRVASAWAGKRRVDLIPNERTRTGVWRRSHLVEWLTELAQSGTRTLVGMDLAFGFPFVDRDAYFPGLPGGPRSVRGLWSLVDEVSGAADVGECYAGRVYLDECSVLRPYFLHGRHRGDRYEGRRRVMETGSRVIPGANPTTVFNLVGPATVGVSSLSGMRLALALERELGESIAFWPFDGERASDAGLVVTEIFPRLYYLRSGEAPGAWADPTAFRRVIRSYQGQFGGTVSSEDEGDAVVAAAALRSLSEEAEVWSAPEAEPFAASMEGWIFGAVDN